MSLISHNLGLAHHWVTKAFRPGDDRDELLQEACLALARAADRWDGKRPFNRYAGAWIQGSLKGYRRDLRLASQRMTYHPLTGDEPGRDAPQTTDTQDEVDHRMSRLPDDMRAVVALVEMGGHTYSQVSRLTGERRDVLKRRHLMAMKIIAA